MMCFEIAQNGCASQQLRNLVTGLPRGLLLGWGQRWLRS